MTTDYSRFIRAIEIHDSIVVANDELKHVRADIKIKKDEIEQLEKLGDTHALSSLVSELDELKSIADKNYKYTSLKMQKLFHHFNENFNKPESAIIDRGEYDSRKKWERTEEKQAKFEIELAEVRKLFNGDTKSIAEFVVKFRDIPPSMLESTIPIAIAKSLLSLHRVKFDVSFPFIVKGVVINPFSTWADTYVELILSL